MPRPSSVSLHPARAEIESHLTNGTPVAAVSAESGIAARSLFRAKAQLQAETKAAAEHQHALHVGSLAAELAEIVSDLRQLRDSARDAGDRRTQVAAARAQIVGLNALADRLGITASDASTQLQDAHAIVTAVRRTLPHYDRGIAARLAQEASQAGASTDLVDALRTFASRIEN
jgi:transposase-like protein